MILWQQTRLKCTRLEKLRIMTSDCSERNNKLANDKINPFLLLIPTLFDFTASTISLFALT